MSKPNANNRYAKYEKLCSTKLTDLLFKEGISKNKGCLRITYHRVPWESKSPVQTLFSVSKKQFHRAVDRNLLKRRMREAFRINKQECYNKIQIGNKILLIAFIYVGKTIKEYAIIESDMLYLLNHIQETG